MSREEFQQHLVQRATADEAFRQALTAEPRATIEEETGLHIPNSMQVTVLQETPERLCLVLPASAGELSDLELEVVAGGCGGCPPTASA